MSSNIYLLVLLLLLSLLLLISGAYSAQEVGYLSITSEPKNALIYLDANYVGSLTPTEKLLPHKAGWCTVQLSKREYELYQERMLVKRGQVLEIHVVFARADSGKHSRSTIKNYIEAYLTVTSEPPGADVSLDGKLIGKTPVRDYRILAGSAERRQLSITKAGYQTHEKIVGWPELRDKIRIHSGNIKLDPIGKAKNGDETNRRFIMDAAVAIIFALLLIVISILATLIIVKLRQRGTVIAHSKTKGISADRIARNTRFGKYVILGELGSGGMSKVYKAQHSTLNHLVALKIPHQNMLQDEQFVKRFLREVEIGSRLHHPNIVRILDHGLVKGVPYLAMEFINGENLRSVIGRESPLSVRRASLISIQICQALDYAHSKQVFHRDVKPDNIMLSDNGEVRVMDFGIALAKSLSRLSVQGEKWLSVHYRFPDKEVTPASDLYSLGIVFYEMLTGRVPFSEGDLSDIMRKHERQDPVDPKIYNPLIPADVNAIIMRLLRKDPKHRFREASEVINVLERFRH